MFNSYVEKFMGMTKAQIIREGVTWGVIDGTQSTHDALMQWKKATLAREVAYRLERLALRGY